MLLLYVVVLYVVVCCHERCYSQLHKYMCYIACQVHLSCMSRQYFKYFSGVVLVIIITTVHSHNMFDRMGIG